MTLKDILDKADLNNHVVVYDEDDNEIGSYTIRTLDNDITDKIPDSYKQREVDYWSLEGEIFGRRFFPTLVVTLKEV